MDSLTFFEYCFRNSWLSCHYCCPEETHQFLQMWSVHFVLILTQLSIFEKNFFSDINYIKISIVLRTVEGSQPSFVQTEYMQRVTWDEVLLLSGHCWYLSRDPVSAVHRCHLLYYVLQLLDSYCWWQLSWWSTCIDYSINICSFLFFCYYLINLCILN